MIDTNAIHELKEIGKLWKNPGKATKLTNYKNPIICSNLAKKQKMNSSWSSDMNISDFANDDNFYSAWVPSPQVKQPYLEIIFNKETTFDTIGIVELSDGKSGENGISKMDSYKLQYWDGKGWENIQIKDSNELIRIHRFNKVRSSKIRLQINKCKEGLAIAELMVYNERR